MKQSIKKMLRMFLLLVIPVYFYSCSDDDGGGSKVLLPKSEGFFVFGTNTIAEEPTEVAARMALAKLDPTHGPAAVDSVYGKYMYIGANSEIQFALVNEDGGMLIGSSDAAETNGAEAAVSVDDDHVIIGTLEEDGDPIEITTEGLYYVVADLNEMRLVITPVKPQVVGDALADGSWTVSIPLPVKSVSKEATVFEGPVEMVFGNGYKYRFNEGWASYYTADFATFSFLGVESYGAAWEAQHVDPGFFNENIPSFAAGNYTLTLTYTASTTGGEGTWTALATTDFSDFSMAIIGDATANGSFNGDGTGGYQPKTPTKSGTVFTWTWDNVPFLVDKEFIFLQNATWGGLQIDYTGATVSGTAISAGNIIDATAAPVNGPYHNYHVINAGSYDVTLVIDAATNTKTVTIDNN
ncbi:MAG: hypothetical protein U0U09_04805 [Cyclobacteriaceae bacterium]